MANYKIRKIGDIPLKWALSVLGTLVSIVGFALWICAENWVKQTTDKYLSSSSTQESLHNIALQAIDKNVVGSTNHAHFFLGRKNDSPQHTLPFYVSSNQQVELQIKATHYQENAQQLRNVQVIIGKNIDAFKISSSSEYKQGLDITSHVKAAMSESPYDFSRNIQKIEFRLDPTQITSSYVYIEALVITKGMPRTHREGTE